MWEWIQTWTLWNWLQIFALVMAVILFLPSAISHWLNLYPKYKNWRASKSKEGFEKRMRELEVLIYQAEKFKSQPSNYFAEIIDIGLRGIKDLLVSIVFLFIVSVQISKGASSGDFVSITLAFLSLLSLLLFFFSTIKSYNRASKLTEAIRYPYIKAIELVSLMKDAREKNFITNEEAKYKLDYIVNKEIFGEVEKKILRDRMDELRLKA